MKILHSGDWHGKDSNANEFEACVGKVVQAARSEKPDLIILAGDLSDRDDTKLDSRTTRILIDAIHDIAECAPVAICGGTPYHDGQIPEIVSHLRLGRRVYVAMDRPTQVLLTDLIKDGPAWTFGGYGFTHIDPEINTSDPFSGPKALVSLFPAPTKRFFEQSGSMRNTDVGIQEAIGVIMAGFGANRIEGIPHILGGHFSAKGAKISDKQVMIGREIEISVDQLEMANADLVCLSHIHKAQFIRPNIFYCGSLYSKDRGELDKKGFYIHDLNKDSPNGAFFGYARFIETPAARRIVIKIDLTQSETHAGDLDAAQNPLYILSASQDDLSGDQHQGAIIHIIYRAWQDEAEQLKKERIIKGLIDYGAAEVKVEILRVPRETVRVKNYFQKTGLDEKMQQQADLRGEGKLSQGVLDKLALLQTTDPEKIIAELPK